MVKQIEVHTHNVSNALRLLAGMVIGGLVGAGVMLLLAPQSGKRTRARIQQKSMELRDQAADNVDDAVAVVRIKARKIKADLGDRAEELQRRGQEVIDGQKEHLSTLVDGADKALQGLRA
jgi:gas vesicle protein